MRNISDMNFDLKQLRSFLEVLNENSFTRASRRLKVGQATISHHISQLEKALGVTLINRTARDVSVTAEGKIFQAFCEKLFKNVEGILSDLDRGVMAGMTRIAASTIPAAYILPPVLAEVKERFPGITCRLMVADSREAVEMVKDGSADLGIVGNEYRHPSLRFVPFFTDTIVLVGPKGYPARVDMEDLVRFPFIVREPGSGTRRSSEEVLGEHGITPSLLTAVLECSSTECIKESVIAGLGVSFVSALAIAKEKKAKTLTVIAVKGLEIGRSLYFVHTLSKQLQRPAQLLLDSLLDFGK